ncbi:M16 family metallopeptidase [Nanoarchaeota archaeon]
MPKVDKFYRQVLPNGLKVIFERRDIPLVVTMAATKFGSGYEPAGIKGIAHLMEHTVFRRTKTRTSQEVTSLIENQGGKLNAFTDDTITAYYSKLRSDHFEIGMDVISDIALNPALMKRDMDMEKKIVLQEIKMNHDNPARHALHKLIEQLYANPFGMSGLGTPETVSRITKTMMQKYHSIYYSPSNMVMSVVGKAEVDHIWNLSRKYFMKKSVQRQIDKIQKPTISAGPFGNYIEKRREMDQAHVMLGYHMPTLQNKLRYAAEIFNNILGCGFTSKLFQQIREKRGLAYAVYSDVSQDVDYALGYIYMGTDKEKADSATKLALAELKKMQKIDIKEVNEAKERLIGKYALKNENSEDVALNLLMEELNGDGKNYYKYVANVSEVKLEDVRQVAKIAQIASSMILPEDK